MCCKHCVAWAVLCGTISALCSMQAMAGTAALSFTTTNGGFADAHGRMLGWQFTVGPNPILISDLGFCDFGQDGLATVHQVGIWSQSDQALLATTTIPSGTAAPLQGFFRYEPLGSSLLLSPGTVYVAGAFDPGLDAHVWDVFLPGFGGPEVNGFSVTSPILLGPPGTARGAPASSFVFPGFTTIPNDTRSALMGPNFLFTVVPEPSSLCLAVGAVAGLLMWICLHARRVRQRIRRCGLILMSTTA